MYESSKPIESFIGKEFGYGAQGPDRFDCWTLTVEYLASHGIEMPQQKSVVDVMLRHLIIKEKLKQYLVMIDKPEPLSIVVFKLKPPFITHMGTVLPDCSHFLHIMEKRKSCIERLDKIIWSSRIEGFYKCQCR